MIDGVRLVGLEAGPSALSEPDLRVAVRTAVEAIVVVAEEASELPVDS
jgi:hypothetical protein